MSGPTRRLLVARHGRTAWNLAGRYQGHADPDLDDEGRSQAARLAAELTGRVAERLVASDLRRARDTAAPLAEALGTAVLVDKRLREVDVGAWEGLTAEEAAERFPDEYAAWRAGEDVARGAGETRQAGGARAAAAIVEHAGEVPAGGLLVVVSHGMVLRAALRQLREDGVADLAEDLPHLGNAAWAEVTLRV
jgi:broad specificity phosphatase PhoE